MALTNLNTLCSAIRGKVGETEKQTLPQLKSIVDNQLVYPQGTFKAETNGIYNIGDYDSVEVATDERTQEDYDRKKYIESLDSVIRNWTGSTTTLSTVFRNAEYPVPFNFENAVSLANFFSTTSSKEVIIDISNVTNMSYSLQSASSLTKLTLLGKGSNVRDYQNCLQYTANLKEIVGEIDLSSVTNISGFLQSAPVLESVRFTPNCVGFYNIYWALSNLGKNLADKSVLKDTMLSIVNALRVKPTDEVGSRTVSLNATVKTLMGGWYCKLVDDIYVDCDSSDDEAITYTSAITTGKGWVLA